MVVASTRSEVLGVSTAESLIDCNTTEEVFKPCTTRRYERCKLLVESSGQIGEWEMNQVST